MARQHQRWAAGGSAGTWRCLPHGSRAEPSAGAELSPPNPQQPQILGVAAPRHSHPHLCHAHSLLPANTLGSSWDPRRSCVRLILGAAASSSCSGLRQRCRGAGAAARGDVPCHVPISSAPRDPRWDVPGGGQAGQLQARPCWSLCGAGGAQARVSGRQQRRQAAAPWGSSLPRQAGSSQTSWVRMWPRHSPSSSLPSNPSCTLLFGTCPPHTFQCMVYLQNPRGSWMVAHTRLVPPPCSSPCPAAQQDRWHLTEGRVALSAALQAPQRPGLKPHLPGQSLTWWDRGMRGPPGSTNPNVTRISWEQRRLLGAPAGRSRATQKSRSRWRCNWSRAVAARAWGCWDRRAGVRRHGAEPCPSRGAAPRVCTRPVLLQALILP